MPGPLSIVSIFILVPVVFAFPLGFYLAKALPSLQGTGRQQPSNCKLYFTFTIPLRKVLISRGGV